MIPINFVAVVLAAVAAFIIGFLMHGPVGGTLWMRLANIHPTGNEKFADMIPQMLWNLAANLVTACGLAVVYAFGAASPYLAGASLQTGLICALVVWVGFLASSSSIEVIWMGRSIQLWLYEAGSSLIVMLAMGAIIALLP